MIAASTGDSRSVTIDYRVDQAPDPRSPLRFGVYRSSDPRFDPGDSLLGTWTVATGDAGQGSLALDDGGQPADALGTHRLTIPLAAGLPPYPAKPYVLVGCRSRRHDRNDELRPDGLVPHLRHRRRDPRRDDQPELEARAALGTPDRHAPQAAGLRRGHPFQLGDREQQGRARREAGPAARQAGPRDGEPVPRLGPGGPPLHRAQRRGRGQHPGDRHARESP